jgi:hypothetical protein
MFHCCVRHGNGADGGAFIDLVVVGFARRVVMDLPFFVVSFPLLEWLLDFNSKVRGARKSTNYGI